MRVLELLLQFGLQLRSAMPRKRANTIPGYLVLDIRAPRSRQHSQSSVPHAFSGSQTTDFSSFLQPGPSNHYLNAYLSNRQAPRGSGSIMIYARHATFQAYRLLPAPTHVLSSPVPTTPSAMAPSACERKETDINIVSSSQSGGRVLDFDLACSPPCNSAVEQVVYGPKVTNH